MKKLLTDTQILSKPITKGMVSAFGSPAISAKGAYERAVVFFRLLAGEQDWFSGYDRAMNDVFEMSDGDKVVEWIIKMYSSSPRIRNLVDSHPNRKQFLFLDKVRANPPFYAHNLYEKKTHGLNLKQMRRLYAMVSRGNQKAITYARNVLGIPFSESPTQVKAVVYHHVRDLAERRVRRNGRRAFATPRFVGKGAHVWRQLRPSQRMNFLHTHFTPQITPRSQEILAGRSFQFLPKNVKMAVEAKYANMEPEEYLRENPLSYHVGGLSSLGARGEERRRMRLGKMEYSALEFARKYPGWHGFNPKNPTGKVIKSLAKKGLVEISNISNQFKII